MDEYEVRITAFEMARESLGGDADVYDIIDYAEKIVMFVISEYNTNQIKEEIEERKS